MGVDRHCRNFDMHVSSVSGWNRLHSALCNRCLGHVIVNCCFTYHFGSRLTVIWVTFQYDKNSAVN